MIERIDHAVVAVASTQAAAEPFERLGLRVGEPTRHALLGSESRTIFIGDSPENSFYIELFGTFDEAAARASGRTIYLDSIARGGGLTRVMIKVNDLAGVVKSANGLGVKTAIEEVWITERKSSDIAILGAVPAMAMDAGLFESVMSDAEAFERRQLAGRFNHDFPLIRLNHLTVSAPDVTTVARTWLETFAATLRGIDTATATRVVRLQVGTSSLWLMEDRWRPAALVSTAAFEVPDLAAAVALAAERGFHPSRPGRSALDGSLAARLPAAEFGGLELELVERV